MPDAGYIGTNHTAMDATVATFNTDLGQLEEAYMALHQQINAIGGIWTDDAHGAYLGLVGQMEKDFANSNADLLAIARMVRDFDQAMQEMDAQHAQMFQV